MLVDHPTDRRIQTLRRHSRRQPDVPQIAIVPDPVVPAPLGHAFQRHQNIVAKVRVFRHVLEHAAHDPPRTGIVHRHEDFSFDPVDPPEPLGQRTRYHRIARTGEHLFRIARQNGTRQHVEQATVGHQHVIGQVAPLVAGRDPGSLSGYVGQTRSGLDARDLFFHGRRYGSRRLGRLERIASVHRTVFDQPVHPLYVRIERVERPLETDFGNQYQRDGQSDTQRNDSRHVVAPLLKKRA